MYVAVKGGETAIANAHRLLADKRRGDRHLPAMTVSQIVSQLSLAVDRVMAEASLYDQSLAALAVKQARGDMIEAIFLLRAYRTTLPRFMASLPLQTEAMAIERRISATFKDLPGGQLLGPTFDYTHRLLDFALLQPVGFDLFHLRPDEGIVVRSTLGVVFVAVEIQIGADRWFAVHRVEWLDLLAHRLRRGGLDGRAARRIVLGDWFEQGSVLVCSPAGQRLDTRALG